jgi:hypothetical protein
MYGGKLYLWGGVLQYCLRVVGKYVCVHICECTVNIVSSQNCLICP